MTNNPCKVITGKNTRWAYVNVWEPKVPLQGGRPKFSIRLIIPKDDFATVAKIKAAIRAAYAKDADKLRNEDGTLPTFDEIKMPLNDGDKTPLRNPEDYANCYYINANTETAPGIVDADMNPVITRSDVYSGVYGRASISFYAFNKGYVRGIACSLNNLQLIRPGEHLGRHSEAAEDFKED